MEKCSPQSNAEFISVMKAGQIGATAAIVENPIAHAMAVAPRHILVLTATKGLAEEWSKKRFGPMVQLCGLEDKVGSPVTKKGVRGTGDTTLSKSFTGGGGVLFASYGQTDFFRSNPFPVVIFDEFERATQNMEGSVRKLGEVRTSMFSNRRKCIYLTTPLELETSKIQPVFDEGTQEYVHIKCPKCKGWIEDFTLLDEAYQIKLEYKCSDPAGRIVDPDSVGFRCPHCEKLIKNHDKHFFFKEGNYKWVKTNPYPRPKTYSFFMDALLAAVGGVDFATLAQEWVDALRDPDDMRGYINLRGARPFEYSEESIDTDEIIERAEAYHRGTVPDGALLVTCGGDLHKDRLDVVVLGFDGDTTWSVEWLKFTGDPNMSRTGSLRKFARAFARKELPGKPKCAFIDMQYMPEQVLKCAETHRDIFAISGEEWINGGDSVVESRTEQFGRRPFIRVNTGLIKGKIINALTLTPFEGEFPEGYQHFPCDYERAYYDELNSEKRVPVYSKKTGKKTGYEWRTRHTMGNHVFDCNVYAWAARDFHLYRIGQKLGLDDYENAVWSVLRDPKSIETLRREGAFNR
jgi:phage terminase large subunit GpA-like protein